MRLPITLHKNYTLNEDGYQLKLPLNLETIIPEDDSVRLLSQFVEGMDLTDLYSTYERINTVSPRNLLKIVLYSYMNGDYSSPVSYTHLPLRLLKPQNDGQRGHHRAAAGTGNLQVQRAGGHHQPGG